MYRRFSNKIVGMAVLCSLTRNCQQLFITVRERKKRWYRFLVLTTFSRISHGLVQKRGKLVVVGAVVIIVLFVVVCFIFVL